MRVRPFSHGLGDAWILPHTRAKVVIFPTRLCFYSLSDDGAALCALDVHVKGPVRGFTVQLDAEAEVLRVWGKGKDGYFKYRMESADGALALVNEKRPLALSTDKGDVVLQRNEAHALPIPSVELPRVRTRLSLGVHKAQEWEKMRARRDLREIFPIWHKVGSLLPRETSDQDAGTLALLAECRKVVHANERGRVADAFGALFLAGMGNAFVPRLVDEEHQGIVTEEMGPEEMRKGSVSPIPILTEGAELIEALFVREEQKGVALLPCLPPQFASGRIAGFTTRAGEVLSLEWTKHKLRRVEIASEEMGELFLLLPKELKRCRRRTSPRSKGEKLCIDEGRLVLPPGPCALDRFEK